ncbi:MAG: type II secretion system F family protein [Halanaerobiales bacterium]
MQEYKYKAVDNKGVTVQGKISGESYQKIIKILEKEGLHPFELIKQENNKLKKDTEKKVTALNQGFFTLNRHKNVLLFSKQLANLLKSGVQLNESLAIIINLFKESNFKDILEDIHKSVKEGRSFAGALSDYPAYFNSSYISMIKAGEESGYLALICEQIVEDLEENEKMRSFIISSMIYPVILLSLSVVAVFTILVFILPKFINIYNSYDRILPFPTIILLNISNFLSQNGLIVLGIIIALILVLLYYSRTEGGRAYLDLVKLRIPILGKLIGKLAVSRITGGLGILVLNGVPLLKSLKIIRGVTGNSLYSQALKKIALSVERGSPLSQAMDSTGAFPDITIYLLGVGEQTGELGRMLTEVGKDMAVEYRESLERFLRLFEPLILLCVALIIGFIVFATLLPVMGISSII